MEKFSKEGKRLYPKRVIEALDGSIEKWYKVTFEGTIDEGRKDCPLCGIFNASPYPQDCCPGCPVNDVSGQGCLNTPYRKFNISYSRVCNKESAELAYNFYKWLKNLRENVDVEEEGKEKVAKRESIPFTLTIETLEEAKELYHRLYGCSMDNPSHPTACSYPGICLRRLWREVLERLKSGGHIT